MTRGWRCKKCRHWNPSPWKRICGACGVERKLKKTKHEALLQAARPQYQAMLEAQGGRCAICLRPPTEKRRLDMDHDHGSMRLRGLLCSVCNQRLDSRVTSEWLRAAAAYLDDPPAQRAA